MMQRLSLRVLAVMPAVALAVLSATLTAARPFGGGLWLPDDVNMSEAVATRNSAEVVRLIRRGYSPNTSCRVRLERRDEAENDLTPFEVAVITRELETATLLLELGAAPTTTQIRDLWCVERRNPSPDRRAFLDGLAADTVLECQ